MEDKIAAKQLKSSLAADYDGLIEEVVEAVNNAQPGNIIPDSEEPVRDANSRFRQVLYEKALRIRQQQSEPAFSPSAD